MTGPPILLAKADAATKARLNTPPPLTLTSRLIRYEALPLWRRARVALLRRGKLVGLGLRDEAARLRERYVFLRWLAAGEHGLECVYVAYGDWKQWKEDFADEGVVVRTARMIEQREARVWGLPEREWYLRVVFGKEGEVERKAKVAKVTAAAAAAAQNGAMWITRE